MSSEYFRVTVTEEMTIAELITELEKLPGEAVMGDRYYIEPYLAYQETEEEAAERRQAQRQCLEDAIAAAELVLADMRKELNGLD